MTRARQDGLYFMVLGTAIFLLLGGALESISPVSMLDFKAVYYGSRCLVQNADPYRESEVLRVFRADGGQFPSDPAVSHLFRQAISVCVYLPTALFLLAPFALLSFWTAQVLWILLTAGSLILASFLIWEIGAEFAPLLAGVLIGFLLANSEVLLIVGNTAGIVIGLCVVAVWCFLRERFVSTGVLCLAFSLAIKPHDAGLVWLYFLLAGRAYRKRALQTLLVTVVLSLPAVLWVSHTAPNWMQEAHANLLTTSEHGGRDDPAQASKGGQALGMMINLQTVVSFFSEDSRICNLISYLICAPLLLAWVVVALRSRSSPRSAWLAIAAIAALTMLPTYHRPYDAKLLLLTVPACAILWAEGGRIGRLALLVSCAGFVFTGDLPWVLLLGVISHLHLSTTGFAGQMAVAAQVFPAPLTLLAMGVFYLWIYAHQARTPVDQRKARAAAGG